MERSVDTAANKRQKILQGITKIVQARRDKLSTSAKESPFRTKPLPSPLAFQDELKNGVIRKRFSNVFIGLVQKKEQMYKDELNRIKEEIPTTQRILEGYSKEFGVAQSAMEIDAAEPAPEEFNMENAMETQEPTAKPSLETIKMEVDSETE
eukprot:scaffold1803_cov92-Amphora_coffeaeformis.AAC.74